MQTPIPGTEQKQTKDATQLHKISKCGIIPTKRAHKPDQTNQPSLGTNHLISGPTRQCTRERQWPEAAQGGSADPTRKALPLSFGGKADLIL